MGIKRILSCHPIKFLGGGSSLDFVPNKNGIKKKQRVAFDFKKNGYDLK